MAPARLSNGTGNDTTLATSLTDPTLPSIHAPDAGPMTAQINGESNPLPLSEQQGDGATEEQKSKKRKRKERLHVLHQATFKRGLWTYFHLELITPSALPATSQPALQPPNSTATNLNADGDTSMLDSSALVTSTPRPPTTTITSSDPADIDPITASALLVRPLNQYLGLTGSAIPVDILKTHAAEVWIRIPREDAKAFRASLSGWIGSCEREMIPGAKEGVEARVRVAWRVKGEAEYLGGLGMGGDAERGGRDLFRG
ncbi:hypothetical protein BDV96DRAFT_367321 [Lophiotrema nucula]|uniref:Ribonucleases P/MRP subunit Pop8-like domain-containing protein n=1 Tax=Lophiotrema nucula TaxID=690887 RepID=A0A6A5ZKY6_9PLEO|nr:hypothetical protein BDV96DRAFT_367321 [Lophiotrema nucula]